MNVRFNRYDKVIFKQRTARHLAGGGRNIAWEYQYGDVLRFENGTAVIIWLQGHHSRTDDVPVEDIVAKYDRRCKVSQIGCWSGHNRLLQPIVKEGE